jgi:hypothetical protein
MTTRDAAAARHRSVGRTVLLAALSMLTGILLPLLAAEAVLRLLPVNGGLVATTVTHQKPVFHFEPDRRLTWSRGWNFATVNQIRVNNAGYVNDHDYEVDDPRPLLAVVGDSYVEAVMVPFRDTFHGRLAADIAPHARVYSLAASGAPLSQYVMWAKEARERWKASALAVVVVGNDFDESLATVKAGPGFHHYVQGADGTLALQLQEYLPTRRRTIMLSSALVRYLVFNCHALELATRAWKSPLQLLTFRADGVYVGNTDVAADQKRLEASQAVVDAFLRDLVAVAGWRPREVLLLVDGLRYPSDRPAAAGSYFVRMRTYLMAEARRAGFEAVDLDTYFFAVPGVKRPYFEYQADGHWNGRAHAIVADAVTHAGMFLTWRSGRHPGHGRPTHASATGGWDR